MVFIVTDGGKTLQCPSTPDDSVLAVKHFVAAASGEAIAVPDIRLVCGGRELDEDGMPLMHYDVGDLSTLHMSVRLRGGCGLPTLCVNCWTSVMATCTCLGVCLCGSCCKVTGTTKTRIPYLLIMLVFTALAMVLRYTASSWTLDLLVHSVKTCEDTKCVGFGAVYRISFLMFIFFALHFVAMLTRQCAAMHTNFWCAKLSLLLVGLVIVYLIPNDFFDAYAIAARFTSVLWLLAQVVILIDFAYLWNADWVARDNPKWQYFGLLPIALVLLGGSITLWAFSYDEWFSNGGDCARNDALIAVTIVLSVLVTFLSITSWVEHGSILASGVVVAYSSYLLVSALSSDPSACNSLTGDDNDVVQVIVGLCISVVAVFIAGWNMSTSKTLYGGGGSAEEEEEEQGGEEDLELQGGSGDGDGADVDEAKDQRLVEKNRIFHLIMMFASVYMAMLLTNWDNAPQSSSVARSLGLESLWVKMSAQFLTMGLYLWTLLAPKLFPDRDFS